MAGEQFVDLAYRGIDLARRVRLARDEDGSAYLHFNAPMPVGTAISIICDEGVEIPVQVVVVQEQVAGAPRPPGMQVRASASDPGAEAALAALITPDGD